MARNFPHSFIVCDCKQVSLGELIYAIKEKGAKTLEDLEDCDRCALDRSLRQRLQDGASTLNLSPSDER